MVPLFRTQPETFELANIIIDAPVTSSCPARIAYTRAEPTDMVRNDNVRLHFVAMKWMEQDRTKQNRQNNTVHNEYGRQQQQQQRQRGGGGVDKDLSAWVAIELKLLSRTHTFAQAGTQSRTQMHHNQETLFRILPMKVLRESLVKNESMVSFVFVRSGFGKSSTLGPS